MDLGISFIIIILFLICSAFFSGSETAFFSLSKVQIKKLENSRRSKSRRIIRLLKNPRELLIIILLGNTIVNVLASSTAALIAIKIGEIYMSDSTQGVAIFVEIIIMTLLLLVFGEITPKLIAYSSPLELASSNSFFIEIMKYLLWPAIKILELISALFSKVDQEDDQGNLTTEEFKNLINSKATEDSLEENEKKIIASIFKFSSTTAREILIPRVDMIAADISDGVDKIKEIIMSSGHSKIPIFKNIKDSRPGKSRVGDKEISKRLGLTQSTVRNYRFRLKEKARQAKIFLVLHQMMEKSVNEEDRIVDVHRNATMIDERYSVTESERLERLSRFFNENGELIRFPKKEKDKVIVLREIARVFKPGLNYSEEQANEMLKTFYDDYVLLRRCLIEYRLIDRKPDGSAYWLVF